MTMKISKETRKAMRWFFAGITIAVVFILAITVDYAIDQVMEIGPVHRKAMENIVAMVGCSVMIIQIGMLWLLWGLSTNTRCLIELKGRLEKMEEDQALSIEEMDARIREMEEYDAYKKLEKEENN